MRTTKKNIINSLMLIIVGLIIVSCEDQLPSSYIPQSYVEAYLFVGEPIRNIIIEESQPVLDSFRYDSALVKDAIVKITVDNHEMLLQYSHTKPKGYYYPDTTYLIEPGKTYKLNITLKDGKSITAETKTPTEISWKKRPYKIMYYPKDSVKIPSEDSLKISWSNNNNLFYIVRTKCLDTMDYGKYLSVPTNEKNRRIFKPFKSYGIFYNDPAVFVGPLPGTEVPVAWNTFKWFGLHEVTVFCPDINYIKWFIHLQRSAAYDYHLASVNGAMGVFGSASIIKDTVFIMKNIE